MTKEIVYVIILKREQQGKFGKDKFSGKVKEIKLTGKI